MNPKKIMLGIITSLVVVFNVFLIVRSSLIIDAARDGLQMWFTQIVPVLLPFTISVNLLTGLGFVRWVGQWFAPVMRVVFNVSGAGAGAVLAGFAGGYPMGAKTVAELRYAGVLRRGEAQRLLAFCNNAGPVFVIGFVGVGLFGDARAGALVWLANALSALVLGVVFRFCFIERMSDEVGGVAPSGVVHSVTHSEEVSEPPANFGKVLGDSVHNAMESMLIVCGYVVFFCALIKALEIGGVFGMLDGAEAGFAAGLLEMVNGARILAGGGAANRGVLAATAAIVSFGGLSIHAQSSHFLRSTDLRFGPYLLAKGVQAVLAWGLVWFVLG